MSFFHSDKDTLFCERDIVCFSIASVIKGTCCHSLLKACNIIGGAILILFTGICVIYTILCVYLRMHCCDSYLYRAGTGDDNFLLFWIDNIIIHKS